MFNGQILQDLVCGIILGEKGFFLDIGSGCHGNEDTFGLNFLSNTFFLEKTLGWSGISIDYDCDYIEKAKKERSCNLLCKDLLEFNINDILDENNCPDVIDYISFDVDGAQEKCFNEFDWAKRRFRFLTLEHNLYYHVGPYKEPNEENKIKALDFHTKSREKILSFGYSLLSSNVSIKGLGPVEDWYIDKSLCDKSLYGFIENSEGLTSSDIIDRSIKHGHLRQN